MEKISTKDWKQIIKLLSNKSGFIAKLMMNEMPDNIEVIFRQVDKNLLPHSYGDYPTFWNKQSSFIDVMEEFYLRLRKNSQKFR